MANNYSQATMVPFLPESAVSEFEAELLNGYGFSSERTRIPHKDPQVPALYFFTEEGLNSEPSDEYTLDDLQAFADRGDTLAQELIDQLRAEGVENDKDVTGLIEARMGWECIVQRILRKPECSDISDIVVMGADTCDKMRPGEFGGWVVRITREEIQQDSTYAALDRFRKEDAFYEALDIVYELAEGNVLDFDDGDESLIEQRLSQKNALAVVHDYLVNHPNAD